MAITSIGYDGTVNEAQWALLSLRLGAPYWFHDAAAVRAAISTSVDRGVYLSPGVFGGAGVRDESDSGVTLPLDAAPTAGRWDMIVARRNWQGAGGVTTFEVIKGTASKTLPTFNRQPGLIDDQPIALARVQAGSSQVTEIVDLRGFATSGSVHVNDKLAMNVYDTFSGIEVQVGREIYRLRDNRTWMRVGLEPAASPAYRVRFQRNGITLQEGVEQRISGTGWSRSGDNTMDVRMAANGVLTIRQGGIYSVGLNWWSQIDYQNVQGSTKVALDNLWGTPDIQAHKNAYPRGHTLWLPWHGYLPSGHTFSIFAAHWNQEGRRMNFNAELLIEMIG